MASYSMALPSEIFSVKTDKWAEIYLTAGDAGLLAVDDSISAVTCFR